MKLVWKQVVGRRAVETRQRCKMRFCQCETHSKIHQIRIYPGYGAPEIEGVAMSARAELERERAIWGVRAVVRRKAETIQLAALRGSQVRFALQAFLSLDRD